MKRPIVVAVALALGASCSQIGEDHERDADAEIIEGTEEIAELRADNDELRADNEWLLDHICSADPTFYRCTGD